MSDLFQHILIDIIFCLIAGYGFAYVCFPPKNTLKYTAILAAIAYTIRSLLIASGFFNLAGGSFVASFIMGILAMSVAKKLKTPVEVIVFPSLLPMLPGIYAFKSILSILIFFKTSQQAQQIRITYLLAFFDNLITTISVSLALVSGIIVTLMIFYEQSFMMTRGRPLKIRKYIQAEFKKITKK